MNAKPISENNASGCSPIGLALLGFLFSAVGGAIFWFLFLVPFMKSQTAKSWPKAEAKIINSRLIESKGDDSSSYRVEFTYRYTVEGQPFSNKRYDFYEFNGSYKSAKKLQAKHPIGSTTEVYYEPSDPQNSVMSRELTWFASLFALLPITFMVAGGVIAWGAIFRKWGSSKNIKQRPVSSASLGRATGQGTQAALLGGAKNASDYVHPQDLLDQQFDGPLKLKPDSSRIGSFWVSLFFCFGWNGFIWFFIVQRIMGAKGIGGFDLIFIVPFALAGVGILAWLIHSFLRLFNPTVEIALSNGSVPIGGEFDLAWEVTGNVSRFKSFDIFIVGEESATYRRGTDTITDTNQFQLIHVIQTSDPEEIAFGSKTMKIPDDTIHTFDATNNKVTWKIEVLGDIPFWPDVNESLGFRVSP